jgi:hypothetical protein
LIDKPDEDDEEEDDPFEPPISGSMVLSNYLKKHFDVKIALNMKLIAALKEEVIEKENEMILYELLILPSRKNEYLIFFILQGKN